MNAVAQPSAEKYAAPVPRAVREQAKRAEDLQRRSLGIEDPEAPVAPVAPGATTEAASPTPAPAPAPSPAPAAPVDPDIAQQLSTTQGRLRAERERNEQLTAQVSQLQRSVEELQSQARNPPPVAPTYQRQVTPEMEQEYGADLIEVMRKSARDEVSNEMEELRGQIANLQNQLKGVGGRVAQNETERLLQDLGAAVPNWKELNVDPQFIAWLQQPEVFSGIKRHDLLGQAFAGHDAPRVIRFFKGYLDEAAATGLIPTPVPTPTPADLAASERVTLESLAAPGRAAPASSHPAPQGQKPVYSRAQIAKFYTDRAAGKYRGHEAEAAALEQDIIAAGNEGRVRG